jgi:MacB-like periplasmic core domain
MNLFRRIMSLKRRGEVDSELDEELRAHLQMRTDDNISTGMSAEAAAREARLRFGNPTVMKERAESMDVAVGVESVWQDVRYALRGYVKSPVFTLVAIATLGLGIGANTAIFQLLDAVRLRSLPIAAPQELAEVKIVGGNQGFGITDSQYAQLTQPVWEEIRRHHDPFSSVFAWRSNDRLLGPLTDSRRINSIDVSGGFFSVLGVQPSQGRLLQAEDETIACTTPRAVVSYPFWQSEMGGRALTAGNTLVIDGKPIEVVGVSAPRFFGLIVGESFDIALPLCLPPDVRREIFDVSVMGRMKPGWTMDRASGTSDPSVLESSMRRPRRDTARRPSNSLRITSSPSIRRRAV